MGGGCASSNGCSVIKSWIIFIMGEITGSALKLQHHIHTDVT